MRKVIRGKLVQLIFTDDGEDWSINILHNNTLLDYRETKKEFRVFGGKKSDYRRSNRGRPVKNREA